MVDINLIPDSLRKDGKQKASLTINIPQEILLGVGSGLVLLLVTVHVILGAMWLIKYQQLSLHNQQWQKVSPDKKLLDNLTKESKDVKFKIDMLSDITVKKSIRWAPKFNIISYDLPKGLWFRKMTLDKTSLSIEGSVFSKTKSEINNVGAFLSALKLNDDFMKDFSSLEVNSIQRGKASLVDITDFTVMAKLNEKYLEPVPVKTNAKNH